MSDRNWFNLAKFKCPECSSDLRKEHAAHMIECSSCDFRIGVEKFNRIVESQMKTHSGYRASYGVAKGDNQDLLNNLDLSS